MADTTEATLVRPLGVAGDESRGRDVDNVPVRIGRYALLSVVGRGGMGVVYAAFDDRLDRKVAIKLLRERADNSEAHARLLREAQALAQLAHPNVVAVHDVGEADGQVYLAMEFLAGRTLRAWLKDQVRTRTEIVEALRRLVVGWPLRMRSA